MNYTVSALKGTSYFVCYISCCHIILTQGDKQKYVYAWNHKLAHTVTLQPSREGELITFTMDREATVMHCT